MLLTLSSQCVNASATETLDLAELQHNAELKVPHESEYYARYLDLSKVISRCIVIFAVLVEVAMLQATCRIVQSYPAIPTSLTKLR